jgi:hypothetical protein
MFKAISFLLLSIIDDDADDDVDEMMLSMMMAMNHTLF